LTVSISNPGSLPNIFRCAEGAPPPQAYPTRLTFYYRICMAKPTFYWKPT